MCLGECIDLHALAVDTHGGRYGLGVAVEVRKRADYLRCDADVGDGRRVAMAELAGLALLREMAFDRFERAHRPVREPAVARGLVLAHLFFQIIPHTRNDQWMAIRRSDQREAAHARAPTRVLGQQGRLRARLLQILKDRQRLEKRRAAFVGHQRRNHALRVDREILVRVLLALEEIDRDLFGVHPLHVKRHANAVGGEGPPEAVELHGLTLMFASLMSFSYFAISSLMNFANCSGVLETASTPRSAKRFFTSGSASALTVSAFSFCTMGRGVPAGKSTPHQLTATRPGASFWHTGGSGRSS